MVVFDQDGTFYSPNPKLVIVIRKETQDWIQKSLEIEKTEF